jgi:hypothetical protein
MPKSGSRSNSKSKVGTSKTKSRTSKTKARTSKSKSRISTSEDRTPSEHVSIFKKDVPSETSGYFMTMVITLYAISLSVTVLYMVVMRLHVEEDGLVWEVHKDSNPELKEIHDLFLLQIDETIPSVPTELSDFLSSDPTRYDIIRNIKSHTLSDKYKEWEEKMLKTTMAHLEDEEPESNDTSWYSRVGHMKRHLSTNVKETLNAVLKKYEFHNMDGYGPIHMTYTPANGCELFEDGCDRVPGWYMILVRLSGDGESVLCYRDYYKNRYHNVVEQNDFVHIFQLNAQNKIPFRHAIRTEIDRYSMLIRIPPKLAFNLQKYGNEL